MCWLIRRCVAGMLLVALLPSGAAAAQTIARTFAELQALLKPGDYVLIIDRGDHEVWGKVIDVSRTTLALAVVHKADGGARITTSEQRVFSEENVRLVLRSDWTGGRGAAVYPASWDGVDELPPATDVSVVLESGERRRYRFARADADSLRLLTPSGEEVLKKSRVLRVERHDVNDPTHDGAILGGLIGAGAAVGAILIAFGTACETCDAPEFGPLLLAAGSYGAGIGALSGWIVDKLHKGKHVIFPAVSPALTAPHMGVIVSVRF